ncbi:TrmB family transcriptional regulator [Clostridium sp. C8-1-8]|uniref:TrmB family transcriptional regulator n=1 Tax=Clostridium sp. C8-1-8 TaxID=2698831 RepID=UPI00136C110D|nr:TrmB family transcriptional regulator [Clostridium sp. C8-1-8]
MDEILSLLEKLNFSKNEAAIYIELIKNSSLNGYQIAKNLKLSRSSVYSALDNLYERGVIFLVPGDTQLYKAEDPTALTSKMKRDFVDTADLLENKLRNLKKVEVEERYLNIEGYENIVSKTKELLLAAEKEVYINTDFDLRKFSEEFEELKKKKVRTIVFSFSKNIDDNLPIELYTHSDEGCENKETRIMLVVDCKKTLVADRGPHREEFLGTFTDNTLFATIISEHIHNDIYLLKLKNKYEKNLINEDIKLNTILENR